MGDIFWIQITNRLSENDGKKYTNSSHKRTGMAMLTLDKFDFKTKKKFLEIRGTFQNYEQLIHDKEKTIIRINASTIELKNT